MIRTSLIAVLVLASPALGDGPDLAGVEEIMPHIGEMSLPLNRTGQDIHEVPNSLRFEPLQSFEDMFLRNDVVYLMRHGPTDWSMRDKTDVAPTDCENQRVMSPRGYEDMFDLGELMAFNDIMFGTVIVSEWCRNQQTYETLMAGYDTVKPGMWETFPKGTFSSANLLLASQGAPNVTNLRRIVSQWDGGDGTGPLLIITHFTNIQELTEFSVYEGEILVLDPKRDNRVLGYLRLKNAGPDEGHFSIEAQATGTDGDDRGE